MQYINNTISLNTFTKGEINVQFDIGVAISIGSANIITFVGKVQFYIVHANTPFLFCFKNMDKLKIYYNNLTDVVMIVAGNVPIVQQFEHSFIL